STLYIISRQYIDSQMVGECRVPLSPTFTLHSPYIIHISIRLLSIIAANGSQANEMKRKRASDSL
ncbi:MAG: hypothetical protein SPE04_05005, partial [Prevotella sp.]|nr:hypothetical protein [Prevotella sp.]